MTSRDPPSLFLTYETSDRCVSLPVSGEGVTIGRIDLCDVVLPGAGVSRVHAEIRPVAQRWVVRDLGSSNGTRVNGEAVETELALGDGDRLLVGETEITCRLGRVSDSSAGEESAPETLAALQMGDFDSLLTQVLVEDAESVAFPGGAFLRRALGRRGDRNPDRPVTAEDAVRLLRMVHEATEALVKHDNLDAILERVSDLVFEHLPAERCFVLLQEHEGGALTTCVQRFAPGVSRRSLRISGNVADEVLTSRRSLLVKDTAVDLRLAEAESIVTEEICSVMCAPLCHQERVQGFIYVDTCSREQRFSTTHLGVLSILAAVSAAAVERARLHETLERERRCRERLSRYHAPHVVDRIVSAAELDDIGMEAEERMVSVLFADVVGFSRLAEALSPREVTGVLNELFQILTEEVFAEGGTLDKFIGDAILVFFGAPLPAPDHAERAVRTALAMLSRLEAFNAQRESERRISLRIGINTGPAVVGDVGALQRRDYTVIGDTVNVASRLESSVAGVGQIVIGPRTHAAVQHRFACRALEPVVPRGRTRSIQPYLVIPPSGAPGSPG